MKSAVCKLDVSKINDPPIERGNLKIKIKHYRAIPLVIMRKKIAITEKRTHTLNIIMIETSNYHRYRELATKKHVHCNFHTDKTKRKWGNDNCDECITLYCNYTTIYLD